MFKYFRKQRNNRRSLSSSSSQALSAASPFHPDDRNDDDTITTTTSNNSYDTADNKSKRLSLRSTSSFCDELLAEVEAEEDDECSAVCSLSSYGAGMGGVSASVMDLNFDDDKFKCQSRLSMSLPTIVNEPNCLSYFVQYLETKKALPLIKFYLDIENFKNAALEQLEKDQAAVDDDKDGGVFVEEDKEKENEVSHRADKDGNKKEREDENNCENQSSVPGLKTLCDLSMRKPLTDDEKSRIYAETNKQITKFHSYSKTHSNAWDSNKLRANSELSLCSLNSNITETDSTTESNAQATQSICAASIKDAFAIYKKYLIGNCQEHVRLPVAILSQISLLLCKRNDNDKNNDDDKNNDGEDIPEIFNLVSSNCFDDAQQHVLQLLESEYLNEFLQSRFYCKYCIELIENENATTETERLNIYDILCSEVTLFYFMEFLEQHGERDSLDFWTAAMNFRKIYAHQEFTYTPAEAQADAMIIYDKFFSLQSDRRLWLSDKLRSRVEERICSVSGRRIEYCFDLPLLITAMYLERKFLKKFVKSQLFENYLNELKIKIQEESTITKYKSIENDRSVVNEEEEQNVSHVLVETSSNALRKFSLGNKKNFVRHRKTLSDCTNQIGTRSEREHFKNISQQNTLLAMDTSGSHMKQLHGASSNLSIDSRHLTNPNLLWHRPLADSDGGGRSVGGLKFGRVNSLGRYERDFDTVDIMQSKAAGKHNQWSLSLGGNKLKNAMRKLVNLPEEKVQEEIAWQVAEMIVKDVTSITLNKNNNKSSSDLTHP